MRSRAWGRWYHTSPAETHSQATRGSRRGRFILICLVAATSLACVSSSRYRSTHAALERTQAALAVARLRLHHIRGTLSETRDLDHLALEACSRQKEQLEEAQGALEADKRALEVRLYHARLQHKQQQATAQSLQEQLDDTRRGLARIYPDFPRSTPVAEPDAAASTASSSPADASRPPIGSRQTPPPPAAISSGAAR